MTLRRPSGLTLLTAALLLLLPTLAVLQYRWVGQISEAERERMRRNVRNAADQFGDALDDEISRALVGLQVDGAIAREEAWDRYADRYASWIDTAAHPNLISAIFLVDLHDDHLRLRKWNAQAQRFEEAPWEGRLASWTKHFHEDLRAFATGRPPERGAVPFREDDSMLVAPLVNVQLGPAAARPLHLVTVFGFTVLQLNMPFIRDQLLPALTERHFFHTNGASYRVAVVDADDPRKLIYRSDPEAPTDPGKADETETIFEVHRDPLMFVARAGNVRSGGIETRRNVVVSVIGRGGEQRGRVFDRGPGRWRLLVQHQSGSLEAAVGQVRQRNLAISFGILLLMGVSVALLVASSRRAERLASQQVEFVAGVSHELRTPVAVIRSAAENLSHGVVGDPARVKQYGDTIQAEALRLGETVERVLQFAGIEAGRTSAARMPLAPADVIAAAVDSVTPLLREAQVTLDRHIAPSLPPVLGDGPALRSSIENLITNAVKYGGANRWVAIRADAVQRGRRHRGPHRAFSSAVWWGREVRITVEDHGLGIPASDLPHIFEPFYRGTEAISRQIQGNGLGLSLVKRIVEAHGGRVTVETRPGSGSAFTIHLPAAEPTAPADALATEPHPVAGGQGQGSVVRG
jgi:signal transduction histidine kinase